MSKDATASGFVFDPSIVLRREPFVMAQLSPDEFGFGLLLPRNVDATTRSGKVAGKRQEWHPAVITNKNHLYEPTLAFENEKRILLEPIPSRMELRWSLPSIKSFLDAEGSNSKLEPRAVFDAVHAQYEKFLFFRSSEWYDVHSIWDMGTYLHQLFNCYPFLELRGVMGSAKTKAMQVSSQLAFNSQGLQISASPASLFRETHEKRPTKYLDEAENYFRRGKHGAIETEPIGELVNGSFTRGSVVPRVEKISGKFTTIYYEAFSPTQLGSIRGLYGATADRAIIHTMTRAGSDPRGNIQVTSERDDDTWQSIRDSLYVFGLQRWRAVSLIYQNMTHAGALTERYLAFWRPLLSIAKLVGKDVYSDTLRFAERLSEQKIEDSIPTGSFDERVLSALASILSERQGMIRTSDIAARYLSMHPGEAISPGFPRRLSSRLDSLGFRDLRGRDMRGGFFAVSREDFVSIVRPLNRDLCDFSSSSSSSSSTATLKDFKNDDELMTNTTPSSTDAQSHHPCQPDNNVPACRLMTKSDTSSIAMQRTDQNNASECRSDGGTTSSCSSSCSQHIGYDEDDEVLPKIQKSPNWQQKIHEALKNCKHPQGMLRADLYMLAGIDEARVDEFIDKVVFKSGLAFEPSPGRVKLT